jgi:8-oxo-dGTP pyrophosphatase MutT (NUDIX family)
MLWYVCPLSMVQPNASPAVFPVSIKGVVVRHGRVLLLKNDREEWELPGGRIERGETPEECVAREIAEETGWKVRVGPILDSWLYHVAAVDRDMFIVTYGCHPTGDIEPVLSSEHMDIGMFAEGDVSLLSLPTGYRRSIEAWFARIRSARRH